MEIGESVDGMGSPIDSHGKDTVALERGQQLHSPEFPIVWGWTLEAEV